MSRSDPPLSRQGASLAHLDPLPPHDLVLWSDGSVPSPLGKGGSGVLANCFLCGTEATLSFSAGAVFSSFFAGACAILRVSAGPGSTNKSATSLLFSSYLTLVLSSPLCPLFRLSFYLKLCGRSGRNCLLYLYEILRHVGSLDFHRGTCAPSSCSLCSLSSTLLRTQPSVKFLSL